MATTNLRSAYTHLSGARTQGQLENTRERQRQLHALHVALQGAADELLAASRSSDSALNNAIFTQIAITLSTIESHVDNLAIPQSSSFDTTTSKPAGIALILTEDWAPISTSLVPLAAALAAGCQSLIVLPPKKQRDQEATWEVISGKVLTNALDDASFALVEFEDFDSHATITNLRLDIVVSQGTGHAADLTTKLSQHQGSGITIFEPSRGGHSAVIIDRGYKGSFADAAQDLLETVRCAGKGNSRNEARLPRVLFVDEYIVEKCMREIEEVAGKSVLRRLSGKSNDYVEVSDIKESLSNLPGTEPVIFVVTTSSLDDVIDRFNKLNHGVEAPVVYIFAEKPEADYLAQFINSQHSIVGGIPLLTQLLNNPPTPFTTPQTPYPIQSFSQNRPVYNITRDHSVFPASSRNSKLSIAALKARKVFDVEARRSKGGQTSYFTQGLLVSVFLLVLPTLGTVCYGGVKLVKWALW